MAVAFKLPCAAGKGGNPGGQAAREGRLLEGIGEAQNMGSLQARPVKVAPNG